MKLSYTTLAVLACSLELVTAFPSIALEAAAKRTEAQSKEKRCPYADMHQHQNEKRVLGIAPGFNADAQRIDVSGEHAFVPPNFSAGDLRGPCPGLNALANHNYLPHNGWASLTQFVDATNKVFGMGLDIATFLSTYGTVMDGNPLGVPPGWSIGGPPTNTGLLGGLVGGLLGTPQGISGSHNKYETDSSPTRGDLYEYGNDYKLVMSQFEALYSLQPDASTANYNLDVLLQHRRNRFQQSIAENPYFFYGPFTGVIVSQAAFTFIYRFMGNKSAEHPEGLLNQDVLKSFFAITGDAPGSFTHHPGQERIPENWYRRALGDEYTIPFFQTDLLSFATKYPELLSVGGNTGTTNSFTGVNIADLTGGVFNSQTLLEGNNLQCFAYQALQQGAPDILKGLFSDITKPLGMLDDQIASVIGGLGCPQLAKIDMNQFKKFPGYANAYNGHPANTGI